MIIISTVGLNEEPSPFTTTTTIIAKIPKITLIIILMATPLIFLKITTVPQINTIPKMKMMSMMATNMMVPIISIISSTTSTPKATIIPKTLLLIILATTTILFLSRLFITAVSQLEASLIFNVIKCNPKMITTTTMEASGAAMTLPSTITTSPKTMLIPIPTAINLLLILKTVVILITTET